MENPYRVIAYDFGVKNNILRHLVQRGCEVIVVPASTTAEEVMSYSPRGSSCRTAREIRTPWRVSKTS